MPVLVPLRRPSIGLRRLPIDQVISTSPSLTAGTSSGARSCTRGLGRDGAGEVAPLAERGRPTRDRHLDLLRAIAILAVVVGHWLVVVPTFGADGFSGTNALEQVGAMRGLTWFFQVMPLFFIVGGVANGRSWRAAKARGEQYGAWLNTRLRRLATPTLWFFGVGAVAAIGLRIWGVPAAQVQLLAWLVTVPVWFLAVYVFVIAGAPLMLKAHDKFGLWVLPTLLARVVFVDVMRFRSGVSALTYSNFLWVFLFCQQLGFLWLDGKVPTHRFRQAALAFGGLGAMTALATFGPYPMSLVGVPGEVVQNNAPPTLMLLVAGVTQLAVALLLRPLCASFVQRRRVWSAVILLNAHAMTILLWHFTALVIASVVVLPLGIVPVTVPGSTEWWGVRLALLGAYLIPMAGLLWGFGRIERQALLGGVRLPRRAVANESNSASGGTDQTSLDAGRGLRDRSGTKRGRFVAARALAATVCFSAGCALVAVGGLSDVEGPAGLPVGAASLVVVAAVLIFRANGSGREPFGTLGLPARRRPGHGAESLA